MDNKVPSGGGFGKWGGGGGVGELVTLAKV